MKPCVFIVDDDTELCDHLRLIVESAGFRCQTFVSSEEFLEKFNPGIPGCLILDVYLPGLDGQELQAELKKRNINLPIIFLTAYGDIPMAVHSIKEGAADFLSKPVSNELLIDCIRSTLQRNADQQKFIENPDAIDLIKLLTYREKEIMDLAISGVPNKEIAKKLNISYRTVENHRRKILKKTKKDNFFELARLYKATKAPT